MKDAIKTKRQLIDETEGLRPRVPELEGKEKKMKRRGQVLHDSEQEYRSALDSIGEAYFEVDRDGNLTSFNDSTCQILGYTRHELTGMNIRTNVSAEIFSKMLEIFSEISRTKKPAKIMEIL